MKNLYIIYCAVALSLLAGCKMTSSPSSDGPSSEPGADISGNKNWQSIAMSGNGEKLAAVVGGASGDGRHIYTSSNSGAKWADLSIVPGSEISGNRNWYSIAMSSDGERLAAVVFGGYLYTFSNSGETWTNRSTPTGSAIAGNKTWMSIAISDDGKKLAAVVYYGHIYTSTDSGATWTDRSTPAGSRISGPKNWQSIAMSEDGKKLAAVVYGGHIYTSTDSGETWSDRSGTGSDIAGNKYWYSIAMSPDGQELAAVVGGASGDGGHIYTSSNSGETWRDRSTAGSGSAGDKYWHSIAMSDDGQELAAVVGGSSGDGRHIYTSSNGGAKWTDRSTGTISGNKNWISIAMSGNGEKLAAVVGGSSGDGRHIYTSSNSGAAWVDRSE